jgi:hypothetical protein
MGPHPNGILSRDSQVGVPIFLELGLLQLWGRITSRLKQICSPRQEFFNDMLHALLHARKSNRFLTFNARESNYQFDFWPFFYHNLCFRCPNGSCEPILNI